MYLIRKQEVTLRRRDREKVTVEMLGEANHEAERCKGLDIADAVAEDSGRDTAACLEPAGLKTKKREK